MGLIRDSFLKNVLHSSGILTAIRLEDSWGNTGIFHAMFENGDYKVVVDDKTGLPIPHYVCICESTSEIDCICGAYNHYTKVVDEDGYVHYVYHEPPPSEDGGSYIDNLNECGE